MKTSEKLCLGQWLTQTYAGVPTIAGTFVLGLFLLFFRDLDPDLRARLVPAIAIYVLGLSLLALWYFVLGARNAARVGARNAARPEADQREEKAGPQPRWIFISFMALHVVWIILLIVYLSRNGVL